LTYLNSKASHNPIPAELKGIYDDAAYKRQQAYSRTNRKMGVVVNILNTSLTLSLFAFGGFAFIDGFVRSYTDNPILLTLMFMFVVYLITMIIDIPAGYYSTFVIEERFGFNKSTHKIFFLDQLKGFALNTVIMGALLAAIVWIYGLMPSYFWIVAWGVLMLVTLFFQFFYSDLIVPLFNKQTPLEEGELRTAIEEFAGKVGFAVKDIYVMDSSKRSTHANAYFTGFGSKKRIVLYDTLIQQLTTDEIVGVLAHEIGHYKHRHQLKGLLSNAMTSLLMLFLFSLVIDSKAIANAAGCSEPSFYINLLVFSMFYSPVELVLSMVNNVVSRRHEWQADEFAKVNGKGMAVSSGLRKMSANSLSNLTPHPLVVFMEYSHPTLLQRVRHLE
jgi:STE24 endopeptidase